MKSEIFKDNGVREHNYAVQKKVGGETPDFSNPNGFDKLTSLVPKPMHLLTYTPSLPWESKAGRETRPSSSKVWRVRPPRKLGSLHFF